MAFAEGGRARPKALGLAAITQIDCVEFDSARFVGWVEAQGSRLTVTGHRLGRSTDPLILRADQKIIVWEMRPVPVAALVEGANTGCVIVRRKPAVSSGPHLPFMLGDTRDEFTVSRGSAFAYELRAGEFVQIIDVEGQQCSDNMSNALSPMGRRGGQRGLRSTFSETPGSIRRPITS
ncbi:hypothetical protein [Ruegeria sp. MALMAid1280]|uniref:hypothetical protein n=1 Tax=Ruegeria sp. MALMAid1280 TaxID=3411634 RepID=UPI003BA00065